MLVAERFFFADRQSVEERLVRADLEEVFQHTHIERLAETARAGEKIDLITERSLLNPVCYVFL